MFSALDSFKSRVFLMSVSLVLLSVLSESIFAPGLPDLASDFIISENLATSSLTVYLLGMTLGGFFWGHASDYWGRRPMVILGLIGFCLMTVGCYMTTQYNVFLTFRFLQASFGSVSALNGSMTRDVFDTSERLNLSSIIGTVVSIAPAVGTVLGGWMVQYGHWRYTLLLLLLCILMLLFWVMWQLPETKKDGPICLNISSYKRAFQGVYTDSNLWFNAFLIGCSLGVYYTFMNEGAFYFRTRLGMSSVAFGNIIALSAVTYALGCRWCNHLIEHVVSVGQVMTYGLIMMLLAYGGHLSVVYWDMNLLLEGGYNMWAVIIWLTVFSSLGVSWLMTPCFAYGLENQSKHIGIAASWFSLTFNAMATVINHGMSLLHDESLTTMPLYFMSLWLLMAIALSQMHVPWSREKISLVQVG